MGRNARLRKLRREMRRNAKFNPGQIAFSSAYQKKHPDTILLSGNPGEKMSDVIRDFAEPLLQDAQSVEEVRKALGIAMAVWNYSLLDDAIRAKPDSKTAELLSNPALRAIFDFLIARKQQLYPENRRIIVDYQFHFGPENTIAFNVISTPG